MAVRKIAADIELSSRGAQRVRFVTVHLGLRRETIVPLHQAVNAASWVIGGKTAGILLRFVTSAMLWRLLDSDNFGLMAIVFVFLQGIHMFSDIGGEFVIVQSKHGHDPIFRNTIWSVQIIRGMLLWVACCALAWPMAVLYDARLVTVLPVAGLTALISGFCSTAVYVRNRELKFSGVVVNEIAAQATGAIVGVTWALVSPSVWALVASNIVNCVMTTVLSFRLPAAKQQFMLNRAFLEEQLGSARWITLSSLCTFLAAGSDRLILGRLVPTTVLGLYSNALNLSQIPEQVLQAIGSRVLFPLLAMKHRDGGMHNAFLNAKGMLVSVAGASIAILIVAGPVAVPLVFGAKAAAAGWMVQFLAVGIWFQMLDAINSKVVFSQGNTKWVAGATLARFVVIAAALPVSFYLDGVRGTLVCVALSDLPRYIVSSVGASRSGVAVMLPDLAATATLALVTSAGLVVSLQFTEFGACWSTILGMLVSCGLWLAVRLRTMLDGVRLVAGRWRAVQISASS